MRAQMWLNYSFSLMSCVVAKITKILVSFLFFRYSRAMENATPSIQAKMDDLCWWRWRAGWAMAWSWCWISSRMNTCLYGERLVSFTGGYITWTIPSPVLKTSAKTTRLVFMFALKQRLELKRDFFNQLNTKVATYFQFWCSEKSQGEKPITEITPLIPEMEAWLGYIALTASPFDAIVKP